MKDNEIVGIARLLGDAALFYYINGVWAYYKDKYRTIIVVTGDVPKSKRFYEKNGFILSHKIKNFLQTITTTPCLKMVYSLLI
jgi:hypothetical protein